MDDREILDLHRSGRCEEAFTQIVNTYSERLYWHVRTIVSTHEDADDLMQDIFVKVWNALPSFRGEARLGTWLWRIATNEAINYARHEFRRHLPSVEDFPGAPEATGSSGVDGDRASRLLSEAVAQLPPRQRAVFSMRYFDEMPYDEISRVLHATAGALKASYHFAERKVRDYISQKSM